jgi:competence protein ComEC
VAFVTGAAVWAATTPLVAAKFHVVSSVGLVVNVLVAPLVALAMAWGFLCLLAASVSTTLAAGCGAACDGMLHGIATVVHWAARVPAGHTWVAGPPDWWVVGWYAVLAATLGWFPAGMLRRPQTWAAVAGGWIGVGIVAGAAVGSMAGGDPPLRGVVAAVGHGCGIVLRTPEGRCLVFDAGRLGAPAAARRSMAAVLWSEGITRIDTLVISHADTDHFNAVPELLERFAVAAVVVPAALLTSESPAVRDLLERFRERGIPLQTVEAGDSFAVDRQCRVRVLHPTRAAADQAGTGSAAVGLRFPSREADNQTSLVMAVESAGRRWLLTGDIEGEALAGFIAADPDSCDVLVAPHHGSRTSLPAGIAVATKPKVVLVSGGRNPSWPEVRAAYAAAAEGAAVLNTGGTGAIAVDADASGIAISRFHAGRWRPAE